MASQENLAHGLETFYSSETRGIEPEIDIVAVHGIDAHRERTWTSKPDGFNWLKHEKGLPADLPNSRILAFGYASQWLGHNPVIQSVENIAQLLLQDLKRNRQSCPNRPLIFIGHCFGGIVIKEAILQLQPPDTLFKCISGVIFLGTPHKGSTLYNEAAAVATIGRYLGRAEKGLVRMLDPASTLSAYIRRRFSIQIHRASIPLFAFYEQYPTNVSKMLSKSCPIPYNVLIVDQESAEIEGTQSTGLPVDHIQISRFRDSNDQNYLYVKDRVLECATDASQIVHRRLNPTALAENLSGVTNEEDCSALQHLVQTNPSTDMNAFLTSKGGLLPGTGDWILRHPTFISWLNSTVSQTLWVHGNPGKGKTMLAISLVQYLIDKIGQSGSASNTGMAYFFCDNMQPARRTGTDILRGILYQLLCQKPHLCHIFTTEYNYQQDDLLQGTSALQSLWDILLRLLGDSTLSNVFVVIDGLDECETESMEAFLALLEPYINPTENTNIGPRIALPAAKGPGQIKFILTSRNEWAIVSNLQRSSHICLEDNLNDVQASVDDFIKVKNQELKERKTTGSISEEQLEFIRETMAEKSEGTFLWVSLAYTELLRPKVKSTDIIKVIKTLPRGIIPLYGRILAQTLPEHCEDEDSSRHIKDILRSMVLAFRPLELEELGYVANLPLALQSNVVAIQEYVNDCGSFVYIQANSVRLVHLTAKDFLLHPEHASGRVVSLDIGSDHKLLALKCFDYVCNLPEAPKKPAETAESKGYTYSSTMTETVRGPKVRIFNSAVSGGKDPWKDIPTEKFLQYPLIFWTEHTRLANSNITDELDVNSNFFRCASMGWRAWHKLSQFQLNDLKAIHLAASMNQVSLVEKMLQQCPDTSIHDEDDEGATPLAYAALAGATEVSSFLMDAGAHLQPSNGRVGTTPLHNAASHGATELVRTLIQANAEVNWADQNGRTALHQAARAGHIAVVKLLIDHNAALEQRSYQYEGVKGVAGKCTAMHYAAQGGHAEVIELLAQSGANVFARDIMGRNPLFLSSSPAASRTLIELGINFDEQDEDGWTKLHRDARDAWLATAKEFEAAESVLVKGANPSIRDKNLDTPLHIAARYGVNKEPLVHLLIKHRAELNARNVLGQTPLLIAAEEGILPVVKALCEAGADPLVRENIGSFIFYEGNDCIRDPGWRLVMGETALHKARVRKHMEIVEYLPKSHDEVYDPERDSNREIMRQGMENFIKKHVWHESFHVYRQSSKDDKPKDKGWFQSITNVLFFWRWGRG